MEKKEKRKQTGEKGRRWPLKLRVLAMMLALAMMLTSSGMQILAEEQQSETVSAQEVTLQEEAPEAAAETAAPETQAAETQAPETQAPETAAPETQAPETAAPETAAPETAAPETTAATEATAEETAGQPETAEEVTEAAETALTETTVTTETSVTSEETAITETEPIPETELVEEEADEITLASAPIDLTKYLTDDSTMYITVYVDGVKHTYTPEELTQKGLEVPKGAPVKVELYFDTISKVEKGQTLVYQLPANLMDYNAADENGIVWKDIVWEENKVGAEVEAADWVINKNGTLTVTIRDDFFENNKQDDGTLDLFGFNIKFSGSFSKDRGETSGNDDNVVVFRGETSGTGKISFTIPFEYKNEHANVNVNKKLVKFDYTKQIASYQITVTAPETNSYTATNVVIKDKIQCDSKYIENVKDSGGNATKQIYRNATVSTGANTFDNTTGTWTIGSMQPGQEETLTYELKIADAAYKTGNDKIEELQNIATVTFNDDGKHQSYATLEFPSVSLKKTTSVYRDYSDGWKDKMTLATDENGSYVTYTLTVTANNGDTSDITVKDAFEDYTLIDKIMVDGEPSVGSVTIDNLAASLEWKIPLLEKGKSATLTYKAYLNGAEWATDSANQTAIKTVQTQQNLNNSATLYVGDDQKQEPALVDQVSTSNTAYKDWVKKTGVLITDDKDEKYNKLKYTVSVNSEPVSDNIKTIYDTLLSGGTYEDGGDLVINRYTSSNKEKLVDTTTIPLSQIVSDNPEGGYRWDVDLVARHLNGAYYYELIYYVESTNMNVTNYAGIGFGYGPGYGIGASVAGGGGMTYGTTYSKSAGTDNKQEAYTPWTVTVKNTIPEGAIYEDWLSPEYVYKHEQFWFDDACLKDIEITFDGKTLVQGTDYTVEGLRTDNTGYANITDPEGKRYSKFQITFLHEYKATSSNQLLIKYKQRLNMTPRNEDVSYPDGCTPLGYNYCQWQFPQYGKMVVTGGGANYSRGGYDWDTPLEKSNGTYNADDGTVTWTLTVNKNTTISGDATLVEYLPEGLSFVSAKITKRDFPDTCNDTVLGDITQEKYTDANGKTCVQVNIPIKNLLAFVVQSSRFVTADNPLGLGTGTGWSKANRFEITLVTKVDEDWYMNLTDNKTLTNKAVLTDNDDLPEGGITATGTVTIPHTQLIDKSMAGKENPAYVEYALNINPSGSDLAASSDTLEVVDIMGAGMSLSTDHANFFKVYDVTGKSDSDLMDSGGNIVVANVQKNGTDITSDCTIENITGRELDGMTDDEKGKPAYLITVPDGKHVIVIYWATFEGVEDEAVTISNKASFFYSNAIQSGGGDKSEESVVAAASSSTVFTGPFFKLKKTDQYGNAISGVTYTLYSVALNGDQSVLTEIMTQTTANDGTSDGIAYFGHRATDTNPNTVLKKDTLYCLVETDAPAGYTIDDTPYYFEFKTKGSELVDHPSDTTLHQFVQGGTYSFTNEFTPASYSIPVKKTINGKTVSSDLEFSFTLKQSSGGTVYTDESRATAVTADGLQTTIKGSGKGTFDTLYFDEAGTYTFTMTEDELTQEAKNKSYTKDNNTFTVTIKIAEGDNKDLVVESASFVSADSSVAGGDLSTSVPTFNNTSHLEGSITLNAKKEITNNRALPIQAGEFAFTVSVGGEVIAEKDDNGNTILDADSKPVKKLFYNDANGNIEFNIDIDQDDVGTQTYVISEVKGDDSSIKYTTDRVRVKVTIEEAVDAATGKPIVQATKYEYLTDAVFTNEYQAEGTLELVGTKELTGNRSTPIKAGEFNFVVKNEKGHQIATGTTKAGGAIEFTKITYDASDIGQTYTYTISEVEGTDKSIDYTDKTQTVTVKITDAGDGKLNVTQIDTVDDAASGLNKSYYIGTNVNILSWKVVGQNVSLSQAASTGDTETSLAAASVYGADEDSAEATTVVTKVLLEPFVNAYHAAGSVTLKGTKKLTGNRKDPVKENEFKFTVKEVLTDEDGNETISTNAVAIGYTEAGGSITFTAIPYTQADIGTTHTYKITEDKGTDTTVTYDEATATVTVVVSDNGDGSLTAEPTYSKDDGVTFTNAYKATGSVTLAGTKELTGDDRSEDITADEFKFTVKEVLTDADGKETLSSDAVATGKTLAGTSTYATIQFTDISYTQDDIGTHTYVISENAGTDTTIDYTKDTVTATVVVRDAGNGQLTAAATYDSGSTAKFVNKYHIPAPTGIRVDILPYAIMIAIAACLCMLLTINRRKRRSVRRR